MKNHKGDGWKQYRNKSYKEISGLFEEVRNHFQWEEFV